MKLLLLSFTILLTSCTTDPALNSKLITIGGELVTLGLSQKAPIPEPIPATVSK